MRTLDTEQAEFDAIIARMSDGDAYMTAILLSMTRNDFRMWVRSWEVLADLDQKIQKYRHMYGDIACVVGTPIEVMVCNRKMNAELCATLIERYRGQLAPAWRATDGAVVV